jgi:hypothetical protein
MNTKEHIEESAAKVAALNLEGLWFASLNYEDVPLADLLALHEQYIGGDLRIRQRSFAWVGKISGIRVGAESTRTYAMPTETPSAAELLRMAIQKQSSR